MPHSTPKKPTPESSQLGDNLYKSLGEARLRSVLERLYDRLFEDPILAHFFIRSDKKALIEKQFSFLARQFGASKEEHAYTGRSIPAAHVKLGIRAAHLRRRHLILAETLATSHELTDTQRQAWLALDAKVTDLLGRLHRQSWRLGRDPSANST